MAVASVYMVVGIIPLVLQCTAQKTGECEYDFYGLPFSETW